MYGVDVEILYLCFLFASVFVRLYLFFFFFKQKTAYEMRISDWSSDVCSSDLLTMHQDYFLLTGGLERALYRIARKHAGNQKGGWTCRVEIGRASCRERVCQYV